MDQLRYLKQIRNGIYVVALTGALSFPFYYFLNEYSLKEIERMNQEAVTQTDLTTELESIFEQGEIDDLRDRCEEIISKSPFSAPAHYYLGVAHYHQGDLKAAKRSMEESYRILPSWEPSAKLWIDVIEAK